MFNFRPSRFAETGDPWFRIGTFDIGSAGIVSLVVAVSMFIRAGEGVNGPFGRWLSYSGDAVRDGELWRMVTWWMPNEPSLWTVITVALIYLLGGQLEAALGGKERMATYLGLMIIIPPVLAQLIDITQVAGTPTPLLDAGIPAGVVWGALFYTFIAHMPNAPFWFGIPGWVLGAVFFVIRLLQVMQIRNTALIILFILSLVCTLLAAKAFGLAEELDFIPDLSGGRGTGVAAATPRPKKRSRRPKRGRKGGADLTVVPGPPGAESGGIDDFDEMGIDEILDQVNAFGMESLSSEQKRKLKEYSKRKKK